jgi:hypothetical protein
MSRAGHAAGRIEQHMDFLRHTGRPREFNRVFK